ncbi:hypothetical protein D3C80_1068410 [compost metagenome]
MLADKGIDACNKGGAVRHGKPYAFKIFKFAVFVRKAGILRRAAVAVVKAKQVFPPVNIEGFFPFLENRIHDMVNGAWKGVAKPIIFWDALEDGCKELDIAGPVKLDGVGHLPIGSLESIRRFSKKIGPRRIIASCRKIWDRRRPVCLRKHQRRH